MLTFTCDNNYNCKVNNVPEETYNFDSYLDNYLAVNNIFDIFTDISLGFLGILTVTQLCAMCYHLYSLCNFKKKSYKKTIKYDVPKDKYVKIIRGVPGIGKRNYVYYLEADMNREFVICDINDFYTKNGTYEFNGKYLTEAESYMMSKFITAIENNDKRIYVIGTFENTWMYNNYLKIAKLKGYSTYVTELKCHNVDELLHFNKRSSHKVPYSKSVKAFNSWVDDPESYVRPAYLEDNTELLLRNAPCVIDSDSDRDVTSQSESDSESDSGNVVTNNIRIPDINTLLDDSKTREIKYVTKTEFVNLKHMKKAFDTFKLNTIDEVSSEEDIPDANHEILL